MSRWIETDEAGTPKWMTTLTYLEQRANNSRVTPDPMEVGSWALLALVQILGTLLINVEVENEFDNITEDTLGN